MTLPTHADVVVIGSGHNGLVSAVLLARAGLDVVVLEAADTIGGATRTENPFPKVPGLRHSTGSYLLGLMPPELLQTLDLKIPTLRRDPHYFLPTPGDAYLLFGSDRAATRAQMERFFSPADMAADDRMQAELAQLREDLAPAWLTEPGTVEETAARYLRPALQQTFIDLVRGSVLDYLGRFGFESELLISMYAVTDGLSGINAGPDDPGTGHNFLVHNMCRLPGSDGTWMIAEGGMGTVSRIFAEAATTAGAKIFTSSPVASVLTTGGGTAAGDVTAGGGLGGSATVTGVVLANGHHIRAGVVLGSCDPYRLLNLAGDAMPAELTQRMRAVQRTGTTLKVNLALRDLPKFSCLPPGERSPFGSTIHLLPGSDRASLGPSLRGSQAHSSAPDPDAPLARLRNMWAQVQAGELPEEPTIEWYLHTTVDPSLQDEAGHHSSALFVQSVPYAADWSNLDSYVDHLLGICERYAPGTRELVADIVPLTPAGIEGHFGITGGHIHHVDNTVSFTDRMPYFTGVDGLYAGSAGCHPAGSVIGAAGHNAAQRILSDLGR